MREIKFRAWCKNEKKYYYFDGIFNNRPFVEKSTFQQYDSCKEFIELETIEQFTGLHDKNGREIYEGDVVKYLGHEVKNGKQIRPERFKEITSENFIQDCYTLFCLIDCNDTVETIGNIHENPELLKEVK